MHINCLRAIARVLVVAVSTLCWQAAVVAQARCLTSDDVKTIVTKINAPPGGSPNKKLTNELIKLRAENQMSFQEALAENLKENVFKKRITITKEKTTPRLCGILKEFGWPTGWRKRVAGSTTRRNKLKI